MKRTVIAVSALLAGLIVVPATPQVALADTNCPVAAGSYAGGTGTSGDPRLISTPSQLQLLRDDSISGWNKSYRLTTNIDMGGCTWSRTIGTDQAAFTGTLDGGGFVVSNLSIDVNSSSRTFLYVGLVGFLQGSGTITRIGFTGSVAATNIGSGTRNAWAGGLVGRAESTTTISYSFASGAISATAASTDLNPSRPQAGGLVGYSSGTVLDSYATGSATASAGGVIYREPISGGLQGTASNSSSVTRALSSGVASTGTGSSPYPYVGGIAGERLNPSTSTGSFWDTGSSGLMVGTGSGSTAGMTGITSVQMKDVATFTAASWPIVNGWQAFDPGASKVWGICDGVTRPFLLWQYSSSPCVSAPGIATITSVTPSQTSAQVNFTADDTGGSPLTRIEFALDDTSAVDDSTVTTSSPYVLTGLQPSTSYTVYMRAVNAQGSGAWSTGTSFTTLTPGPPAPPPAPVPPSAPLDVRATSGDRSLTATWSAPASSGDYPVTTYQATASPGGQSCLTSATTCTITGLTNGVSYTVSVKALTGAGWSAASSPSASVTPTAPVTKSLAITGSRGSGEERSLVRVSGTSTGLAGARVTLWLSIGGRTATPAGRTVTVEPDGTFEWSRKLNRAAVIYAESTGLRSNAIRLPATR